MNPFTEKLAALIKVKTLVTIAVMLVFTVLALKGTLGQDVVMNVVTMVVAFYFGTQAEQRDHEQDSFPLSF